MERTDIYKELDKEREYQQMRWNEGLRAGDKPDAEKDIAEWVLYIEHHVADAKKSVYDLDPEEALASLRKIAALAIAAMEIHGCPSRHNWLKVNE